MHEICTHLPTPLTSPEEFTHAAVPVDHPVDTRQLVALLKLLDCRFEHPQLAVIVDDELFAETIIPKAQHDINHHLTHHMFAHNYGTGHSQVMIRMSTVHKRR